MFNVRQLRSGTLAPKVGKRWAGAGNSVTGGQVTGAECRAAGARGDGVQG